MQGYLLVCCGYREKDTSCFEGYSLSNLSACPHPGLSWMRWCPDIKYFRQNIEKDSSRWAVTCN